MPRLHFAANATQILPPMYMNWEIPAQIAL